MNRTIYLRNDEEHVFDTAKSICEITGESVSQVIVAHLKEWNKKHSKEELMRKHSEKVDALLNGVHK